ncbi:SigE family RNA polymerase sigma factor [Nocardioides sp. DS6]|uniref:SigE family RNA polymerase sigma factor n=1 Tax=Nocardioides eburneus TaxID=3231482 RepID=A0ABV3T362_9ACTN
MTLSQEVPPLPNDPVDPASPRGEPVEDFGHWVAARGGALQRFAYLVTGNAHDAPDLVQDALAHALPRWKQLAAAGTAEAYVRRSIVNGSISRWRKGRRLVAVEDVESVAPREPTEDETARLEDADAAWQLVQSLPPTQRAAVVLRFYEDLAFAQIALILDCPETTARSHVHRALGRLRQQLAEGASRD